MATILTKKKDTSGAPSAGDLTNSTGGAELAVNTADKRLYTKDSGGNVVEVGINPTSITTGALNTSGAVVFNDAGADVDFRVEGDTDANLLFVDAGNDRVGIGTSSPGSKLETSISSAGSVAYPLRARNSGTTTGSSVGLALTTNTSSGSNASCTVVADATNATGSLDLVFSNSNAGSLTERMRIDSSGNVGIGVTAPDTDLVVGNSAAQIKIFETNTATANAGAITWASGTISDTRVMLEHDESANVFRTSVRTTGSDPWIDAISVRRSNGYVGIGTDTPANPLTISGNGGGSGVYMRIQDTAGSAAVAGIILERSSSALGDWRMQVAGGVLYFGYATDGATFTDLFNLNAVNGIITSQPSYDNTVSGSALQVTSGGVIGRTSSSIKYKKDIETLDADLVSNAIANLRPVWYRTKDAKGDDKETWSHIGLIAEEVHEVEPRLVRYRTEKVEFVDVEEEVTKTREVSPAVTDEDGNVVQEAVTEEYTETVTRKERQKTPLETPEPEDVDYGRLAVLCLAKIQEQDKTIAALEARIAALENA